ncbi:MAG: hypothetical protein WC824_07430 [Bacteroidota bacterium]|jgi:hypothetical protein
MKKGTDLFSTARTISPAHRFFSRLTLTSLLILLLLFLFATESFCGSWPLERKATFLSLGYRGFSGQSYFGQHGEKLGLQRLEEQTLSLYSEYGYSKYVTGIVSIPAFRKLFAQVSPDSPTLSVQSPGDVDLGLRIAMWPGDHDVITLTGLFGIPLGEATQRGGLWAGDDEFNQMVKLGYGHSFADFPLYVQVEAGYNFRSGGYADELHFGAEVGIRPLDPLQILLHVRSVNSQGNGELDFLGGSFGFASNNQRYLMYGPELAVWFSDGVGVNFGLYSVSQARNMPASTAITSGVFFIIPAPSDQ